MGRPQFCERQDKDGNKLCGRAHKGDKQWLKSFLWGHDCYLREVNINRKKYGEIEGVKLCGICIQNIKQQGHIVRKDGKEL
jgi:hypothetical protein